MEVCRTLMVFVLEIFFLKKFIFAFVNGLEPDKA